MLQLKNDTPFKAAISIFPNEKGVDTLYVTVKAAFSLNGKVEIANKQVPIVMADEYWGEPGKSSLKYASELHLTKPSTDIVVIGNAVSPDGRAVNQMDVSIQVAELRKVIRVFGDRKWISYGEELRISPPVPFESMPLVYERAFGGVHEVDPQKQEVLFEARNPVGKGFKGRRTKQESEGLPLPNLEDPARLITKPEDQPAPACFGYVSPSWEPRRAYAGNYDERWMKKRAPYLPEDFKSRYFNAAHPDMIYKGYLKGGEPVGITNMSAQGPLQFAIPLCDLETSVQIAERTEELALNLETALLEPSDARLSLVWRAAMECDKKPLKVRQVDIKLLRCL